MTTTHVPITIHVPPEFQVMAMREMTKILIKIQQKTQQDSDAKVPDQIQETNYAPTGVTQNKTVTPAPSSPIQEPTSPTSADSVSTPKATDNDNIIAAKMMEKAYTSQPTFDKLTPKLKKIIRNIHYQVTHDKDYKDKLFPDFKGKLTYEDISKNYIFGKQQKDYQNKMKAASERQDRWGSLPTDKWYKEDQQLPYPQQPKRPMLSDNNNKQETIDSDEPSDISEIHDAIKISPHCKACKSPHCTPQDPCPNRN